MDKGEFNSEFRCIHEDIIYLMRKQYGKKCITRNSIYHKLIELMGIRYKMEENMYDLNFFMEEIDKRKELIKARLELELL